MQWQSRACLEVKVIWFTFWASICNHDCDRAGIRVQVAAPLHSRLSVYIKMMKTHFCRNRCVALEWYSCS